MPTYIAFLRAVNVGRRAYPMAELRAALTAAGFEDVETHIQTGNVRFRTSLRKREQVVEQLEAAMRADRGFEVPVVLMTPEELVEVHEEALELEQGRELTGHHLALLARPAYATGIAALEARSTEGEEVHVGERAVHLLLTGRKFHEARTGNAEVERHAGTATTRSLTVITKLTEKWSP